MAPLHVSIAALVACALTQLLSSPALAFIPPPARNSHSALQLGLVNRHHSPSESSASAPATRRRVLHDRKKEWVERSVKYYSKVMREEKRRNRGQIPTTATPNEVEQQIELAQKHYFALRKIKGGQLNHAERIYRGIIDELSADDDGCDHAKLAVSTLLLALLLQRMGDIKGTRSVFLSFFRRIESTGEDDKECACSAKVLQAYALFEMKRGHSRKSLEIVEMAVKLDEELKPVLAWKQFREASRFERS